MTAHPALDPTAFYVPPKRVGDVSWVEGGVVNEPLFTPPNPGGAHDATRLRSPSGNTQDAGPGAGTEVSTTSCTAIG